MSLSLQQKIFYFSLLARITALLLQILFNLLIPDHQNDGFKPPNTHEQSAFDVIIDHLIGGLAHWDAAYFLHIAEYGYTYENTAAFFPLFPLCVRYSSFLYQPIAYLLRLNERSVLLISSVVLNSISFLLSAQLIYLLGRRVLRDKSMAYRGALLFCINPATVFFTSGYSESLYSMMTFYGLLQFERRMDLHAAAAFGISAITRSNGLVNTAYLLHRYFIRSIYVSMMGNAVQWKITRLMKLLCLTLECVVLCLTPYVMWQFLVFKTFCTTDIVMDIPFAILQYGKQQGYRTPIYTYPQTKNASSPWCSYVFPLSYGSIQSAHWNVGLFHYFEIKQIPNFLLAAPVLLISFYAAYKYYQLNPVCCKTLGIYVDAEKWNTEYRPREGGGDSNGNTGYYSTKCYVYIVHLVFLAMASLLLMHVQVATRFIFSASPAIYWYSAMLTSEMQNSRCEHVLNIRNVERKFHNIITEELKQWGSLSFRAKLLYSYFLGYFMVGLALNSNGLPWT